MSISTNYEEYFDNFEDLKLKDDLLRGIYGYGFERPSDLQRKTIKPLIAGRDLLCQAQSGTGKTVTYCVGILQNIDVSLSVCQALIIVPAREIAMDVSHVCNSLGDFLQVKSHAVVGGTKLSVDVNTLANGVHIVVGTPGRLLDMMMRGVLVLESLRTLVLDELDELLPRGFQEQLQELIMRMPGDIQIAIFSSTFPPEIASFTDHFLHSPVIIHQRCEDKTLEGIKQYYVSLEKEEWKLDTLIDFFESVNLTQAVVYMNSQRHVESVGGLLRERGIRVSMTHGDMDQHARMEQVREFRTGSTRIHLTTDLLRNEIVAGISVFIHYDMPRDEETYLMRVGRSGCYGRKGFSLLFTLPSEIAQLKEMEKYYNTQIAELPLDLTDII